MHLNTTNFLISLLIVFIGLFLFSLLGMINSSNINKNVNTSIITYYNTYEKLMLATEIDDNMDGYLSAETDLSNVQSTLNEVTFLGTTIQYELFIIPLSKTEDGITSTQEELIAFNIEY